MQQMSNLGTALHIAKNIQQLKNVTTFSAQQTIYSAMECSEIG